MTTHIYSGPLSMFGAKVEIAAREKGVPFELVMVPFTTDDAYEPKHPEVLRVNPVKQQVPVLTDDIDGGVALFDSTQILEYLEERYPAPAASRCGPGALPNGPARGSWSRNPTRCSFPASSSSSACSTT